MDILFIISIIILCIAFAKRADVVAIYAKYNIRKGNTAQALRLFKRANKIGKLSVNNCFHYGMLLLKAGKLDESRTILNCASMSTKSSVIKKRIKSVLALVVWKDGDLDGAIEMLEEVIMSFKNTNAYQNLGLLYILSGDAQKALQFNLEAYDFNSEDLIIADNLAEAYHIAGQDDKAAEIYERLLEKAPHFPEPYYNFGLLLLKKGERERGIELIKTSLTKKFTFLSVKSKEDIEKLLREAQSN